MQLTCIGTGAVDAAPLRGCDCPACQRARQTPEHARGPTCARLDTADGSLVIDAGCTDFGARLDDAPADALLLTHFHVDHVQGLFPFRWGLAPTLPVYTPDDPDGCADLLRIPGCLDFKVVEPFTPLTFGELTVTPVPLQHSKPTLGYVCEHGPRRIAYLTDTCGLPAVTQTFLARRPPQTMVMDCTHAPGASSGNHNDLDNARALHEAIQPSRTVLTHISHHLDAWLISHPQALPAGMAVAADGGVVSGPDRA